jgi:hypothetical protein
MLTDGYSDSDSRKENLVPNADSLPTNGEKAEHKRICFDHSASGPVSNEGGHPMMGRSSDSMHLRAAATPCLKAVPVTSIEPSQAAAGARHDHPTSEEASITHPVAKAPSSRKIPRSFLSLSATNQVANRQDRPVEATGTAFAALSSADKGIVAGRGSLAEPSALNPRGQIVQPCNGATRSTASVGNPAVSRLEPLKFKGCIRQDSQSS